MPFVLPIFFSPFWRLSFNSKKFFLLFSCTVRRKTHHLLQLCGITKVFIFFICSSQSYMLWMIEPCYTPSNSINVANFHNVRHFFFTNSCNALSLADLRSSTVAIFDSTKLYRIILFWRNLLFSYLSLIFVIFFCSSWKVSLILIFLGISVLNFLLTCQPSLLEIEYAH